jgi:signal transduction histidine kinase/DNA-binding response OmpR family regulator
MHEKILIVDDELAICKVLTRILREAGYLCRVADSVQSAKEILAVETFDLLLSDLKMPGESGLELIRYAKAHYPDIGRIIITGIADQEVADEIMEVGVYGYILKPMSKDIVLITIRNTLRHLLLDRHLQAYKAELEKTVSEKTEQLSAIMDNLNAGVVLVDRQRNILQINSKMQQFFPALSPGKSQFCCNVWKTSPEEPCDNCPMAETFTTGKTIETVKKIETIQGKRDFRVVTSPVIDETDKVYAGICLYEDFTENLLLERDLRQSQKLEAVGQLAAGIAHEINTPMQYIGDNIRFLNDSFQDIAKVLKTCLLWQESAGKEDLTGGIHRRLVDAIEEADITYYLDEISTAIDQSLEGVGRVEKIVRAMKDFSHPGSDEKKAANINKILESTVTVSRNEWKYVAEMDMDCAVDLPLVPCLASELSQVFLNIIVNSAHAIDNMNKDSKKEMGKISIRTTKIPHGVEIRITDTGGGIPEHIQERVFEPFFTTKVRGKGTGQGLAIAHRVIVDKHQGRLSFASEKGQGTTFIIELPTGDTEGFAKPVSRMDLS